MREQDITMPSWYREPAFAIQTELCRSLKHYRNPVLANPQKPTFPHFASLYGKK
ncbi:protein of unknown function [Candidatus Nitrotoga arctica]|uniref:Uncharacterized protein n=1 Tax=Candidatus Nitrotoga arctica TaxID=453162 RepID=A0ABM8Z315_9PROT|nr:protein of unknown function [Candidatus Nitrotoga arctica]